MIYLDNAATTLQKPPCVVKAAAEAMTQLSSPGRGSYSAAMKAAEVLFDCRLAAAELFHVPDPERIVFTFNATHGLNLAIRSLADSKSRVLISGYEHNSVTRPLHAIGAEIMVAGRKLFDPMSALLDFTEKIKDADLVVCTCVSNVFGYILPIYEIAELCKQEGKPLIIDASQAAGYLEIDAKKMDASFIAMPGHKGLLGPQGTGLLICGQKGVPLLYGGSGSDSMLQTMPDYLPDQMEAGTHNVPGIAGLLEGLRYLRERGLAAIRRHESALLEQMIEALLPCENCTLYYGEKNAQSGVLSLRCANIDTEEFASKLASRGICVRSGLHCAPLAHKSAGTLETGTVRFSFSPFTTEEEIRQACCVTRELANEK